MQQVSESVKGSGLESKLTGIVSRGSVTHLSRAGCYPGQQGRGIKEVQRVFERPRDASISRCVTVLTEVVDPR